MGSRERKREQLRKRKRRSAEPSTVVAPPETADNGGGAEPPAESFQQRYSRRSQERNEEARAGLEPLAEGERPTAVTVATAVSAVLALIFTVSAVLALATSIEVDGEQPSPVPLVGFAAVLWLMTSGLWKARYWAVLGFQMLLRPDHAELGAGPGRRREHPAGDRHPGAAGWVGGPLLLHDPGDGENPDAAAPRGRLTVGRHQLKPLFDQVVIKELEPDRMRQSGLVVPAGAEEQPPQHGIVLAVGQGVDWWESAGVRMPVRAGDHVVFPATAGSWVEVDEERLLVCRVTELLGVLETVDEPTPIESKEDG